MLRDHEMAVPKSVPTSRCKPVTLGIRYQVGQVAWSMVSRSPKSPALREVLVVFAPEAAGKLEGFELRLC